MSDILVRGIPKSIHIQIQKLAEKENLSVNQALVQWILMIVKERKKKEEEDVRRAEAFDRLLKVREELHAKYGTSVKRFEVRPKKLLVEPIVC